MLQVVETKHHINKPTQVYTCELMHQGTGWAVLRYISTKTWQVAHTHLPKGTSTLAYYQAQAPCVVWRMVGPSEQLLGHLFHICSNLKVVDKEVEYLDLLLDIWVDPQGQAVVLDEDELAECVKLKKLSASLAVDIKKKTEDLLGCWQDWVACLDQRLGQSMKGADG